MLSLTNKFGPITAVEKIKNLNYASRCAAVSIDFVPFVMGSIGGISEDALRIISLLSQQEGGLSRYMMIQALSFELMTCQARTILHRAGSHLLF
jgi:hypothetical protein